jgi:hypothetical protein
MRFYAVKITGAPAAFGGGAAGALIPGAQFCSVINGQNDFAALRVQFHMELQAGHIAINNSFVRIWGVPISMLSQASNLQNCPIEVYGGFWGGGSAGLALELAKQQAPHAGLLASGVIYSAMGNWLGSEMTLDIFIQGQAPNKQGQPAPEGSPAAPGASPSAQTNLSALRMRGRQRQIGRPPTHLRSPVSVTQFDNPLAGVTGDIQSLIQAVTSFAGGGWLQQPLNIIHNMTKGMPLDSVLQQTLSAAFPNAQIVMAIKSGLTLNYDDKGFYGSLGQYAGYIKALSNSIVNGGGVGGAISSVGNAIGGSAGQAINSVGSAVSKVTGATNNYTGIDIYPVPNKVIVHDGTVSIGNVQIQFEDLIGQPTWVANSRMNFMCHMRADILPPMDVTMPPNTLQYIQPNFGSVYQGNASLPMSLAVSFQGAFKVQKVMVIGDSRHPAGSSWCLSVECTVGGSGGVSGPVEAAGG